MTRPTDALRKEALCLFQAAIDAADPAEALKRHFEGTSLAAPEGGKLILLAIGKAACPMMKQALSHVASGQSVSAFVITNYENAQEIYGATVRAAGHPVPDENGHKAAQEVADQLSAATSKDRIIALISGGGSALMPLPVEGVTLTEKAEVNELLLAAGLDIVQMNLVRQQLSQLKGGGMTRLAAPAKIEAFILSDVVGDDLRAIASGPTVSPIGTKAMARDILKKAGVWGQLPDSVKGHLENDASAPTPPESSNTLICSNRKSLEAMQAAYGDGAQIINDRLEGNVADVAPELLKIAKTAVKGDAFLFGGETTVTLTGDGKGGRNQDLALRFALLAEDLPGDWVFLSGGTDGRDGPTDAAGGIVDAKSIERMVKAGVAPRALLDNNDAYAALKTSDDLIMTGGTGTNVADVQVFLRG